jgi:quercetin dioxygenase-like cupin family protein
MKRFPTLAVGVLAVVAFGVAATVVLGGTTRHAETTGVHITPLSHGTLGNAVRAGGAGIEFRTRGPRDMLVTSITVDPGGSFGWHSHPGPVLVSVSKGTLAVYDSHHGSHCVRSTVTAGQAFVEPGAHVHLARNEGSTPVELNAVFLARTGTTEFLTAEQEPKGCNI